MSKFEDFDPLESKLVHLVLNSLSS